MNKKHLFIVVASFLFLLTGINYAGSSNNGTVYDTNLPGFQKSPHYNEQTLQFDFFPGIYVEINAPSSVSFDAEKKVMLVFYALPNANKIDETIGRRKNNDEEWRYEIQHIGAQTRFLRQQVKEYNIVTVYLETDVQSWPWWSGMRPDGDILVKMVVDSVKNIFIDFDVDIVLSGHSGGGHFVLGYINMFDKIPDDIKRIIFLDSNYYYEDSLKHGQKLTEWLNSAEDHFLVVVAYDDRYVEINGEIRERLKGGTFDKTRRMLAHFEKSFSLSTERRRAFSDYTAYSAINGRLRIVMVDNPDKIMLHTVLVERNGFIYSLTTGTQYEEKGAPFFSDRVYDRWIQK
jgi:hypothetical protein